jgi:predicted ATPase
MTIGRGSSTPRVAAVWCCRLAEALERNEEAVSAFGASSEAERLAARAAGQDGGVASLAVMSWALWALGFPDAAAARIAAALERADAIGDPQSEAYARYYASVLCALRREPEMALRHARRCLVLCEEHGLQWRGLARLVAGVSERFIDPSSGTLDAARREFEEYTRRGYQMGSTALYVLLCEALLRQSRTEAAISFSSEPLAPTREERLFEAELHRLRASALLDPGRPETRAEAQSILEEALRTAQRQGARFFELRAASRLARLLSEAGQRDQARDLLAPIYGWFTEGFDTPDLKEAKALLDALG